MSGTTRERRPSTEEGRISSLETAYRQLQSDVHAIRNDIASIAQDTRSSIAALSDRVAAGTRTQWPVIIGTAAILLTVVGFLGQGYTRDQSRLESQVEELRKGQMETAFDRGKGFEQLGALGERIRHLDEVLQREMRQLDEPIMEQVRSIAALNAQKIQAVKEALEHHCLNGTERKP